MCKQKGVVVRCWFSKYENTQVIARLWPLSERTLCSVS